MCHELFISKGGSGSDYPLTPPEITKYKQGNEEGIRVPGEPLTVSRSVHGGSAREPPLEVWLRGWAEKRREAEADGKSMSGQR